MDVSRRALLAGTMGLAGAAFAPPAWAKQNARSAACAPLPPVPGVKILSPPSLPQAADLSFRHEHFRPHRCGGICLERDASVTTKALIHNYGHSAAGITLSWGSAAEVFALVRDAMRHLPHGTTPSIAVIGTGVIGLTSAYELRRGLPSVPLTIYGKDCAAGDVDLTKACSWVAGGQIEPSMIWEQYDGQMGRPSIDVLLKLMKNSMTRIAGLAKSSAAESFGIAPRDNYTLMTMMRTGFGRVVPECNFWSPQRAKFRFHQAKGPTDLPVDGLRYKTYLMNPQIMLPHLVDLLKRSKTPFEQRTFDTKAEVLGLPQSIIVNCTGLGAKTIFGDPNLHGIRGQILVFDNPDKIDYFFSGGCSGSAYMFGRQKDIVLGGTYEFNCDDHLCDGTPVDCSHHKTDQQLCQDFLDRLRKVFYGDALGCGIGMDPMT